MLFVCREAAGSEPAAGVTDIEHLSELGVQSCQGPQTILEVAYVSGLVSQMAAQDF